MHMFYKKKYPKLLNIFRKYEKMHITKEMHMLSEPISERLNT